MSAPIAIPEPDPEDIARGLAELERHLADRLPVIPEAADVDNLPREVDDDGSRPAHTIVSGETKRVRQLRAEVAEAHLLAGLQDDDAPLLIDTPKVRKRRKKAREAARLHLLSQDPAALAYGAARARRRVNAGLAVGLVLALGWSTAGVQAFASEGAEPWSPRWLFAWLVEPFMSITLLCFVGAKAFFATRGQPAHDDVLKRIEYLLLALTLGMNAWPYLPWSLPEGQQFSFPRLVLHLLGPAVAYMVVTGWPRVLARFATLDHGLADRPGVGDPATPLTVAAYSVNADPEQEHRKPFGGLVRGLPEPVHRQRLHQLIAAGQLPPQPSARAIQRALGCATETASRLRDELAQPPDDEGTTR
ncbi:hypothetical protein [Nonomuraea sp. NPDC049158]|uniref:hypothetical protein n=1 Tax=Nonomuraea sp. NPDC049158 TaxID=3155649 RepID=UPI0033E845FA